MSRWSDDLEDEYLKRQTKGDVGQHRRKIATSNYPDAGVNYMESDTGGPSSTSYKGAEKNNEPDDDGVLDGIIGGSVGGAGGWYNYNYPSAPSYNYVPGTFGYDYGYKPSEFTGEYGYKPTQFQYQSQYADLINAARDRLHNWNYDPNSDVSYNAYKNQYTRLGDKAMTDALARYASRTGGVANSYAAAAAQQQYNNYMSQLAAKVPELEQLAYNRAQIELNDYLNAEQTDYNRAFNEYTDWENRQRAQADTEYNNAWNEYADWENRLRTQADTEYDVAYRKWQTEENAREQAAQNAYNNAMNAYNAQMAQIKAAQSTASKTNGTTATGDKEFDAFVKKVETQVKGYKTDTASALKYLNDLKAKGYFDGHDSTYQQIIDTYGLNGNKSSGTTSTDDQQKAWTNWLKPVEAQVKSRSKNPYEAVQYLVSLQGDFKDHDDDFNRLIRVYGLGDAYEEYLDSLSQPNNWQELLGGFSKWLRGATGK